MRPTDWIQALSTLALVIVTWIYVKKTSVSAIAAKKLAEFEAKKYKKMELKIKILRALLSCQMRKASTGEISRLTGMEEKELESLLYEMLIDGTVLLLHGGDWFVHMEKGAVG